MNRADKEPEAIVPQSPRFFRRKFVSQVSHESTSTAQGKVALGEVEEKLKSMRQKRLDRLSTFVVEQSKLSEERGKKNKEGNEIEDAIMSMKQTKEDKKATFKSIVEEQVIEKKEQVEIKVKSNPPKTPKLSRKTSNESTTKKFINKFNCTTQSVSSSVEDLTGDYEDTNSVPVKPKYTQKPQVLTRSSLEDNKTSGVDNAINTIDNPDDNPLLSPIGKQRKGIYLYDRECKFLENEKSGAFTKREFTHQKSVEQSNLGEQKRVPLYQPDIALRKYSELSKTSSDTNLHLQQQTAKSVVLELKTRNSYENRSTVSDDKPPVLKSFKRNSLGDILDSKLVNKTNLNQGLVYESPSTDNKVPHIKNSEGVNQQGYAKISKYSNLTNYKNIEQQFQQNEKGKSLVKNNAITDKMISHQDSFPIPPKSPMPLPRKISTEEKIFKKFQRNLDSLNEITENDSDVDSDEMEDLKKTYEEVNTILIKYSTKLNKLETKSKGEEDCSHKLNTIKEDLRKIQEEITNYKGLKRDSSYREFKHRLSRCFAEINKIKSIKADVHSQKQLLLKQVQHSLQILEDKVKRNEDILLEVFEEQVSSISTNIFNITRV